MCCMQSRCWSIEKSRTKLQGDNRVGSVERI
jgi:hypothetical protein